MNKKIALILACCAATSFAACNETTEWNFTESCNANDNPKRCVESTIQVCEDGVWVPKEVCEGNTPWCDVKTHTCIAKPVAKDCQDGAQKCAENAVWTCKNGKWEKTTDCNEGDKTCNSTTYVCDPKAQTEVTCDHDGTKLAVGDTVCSDNTTLQTCTANADGTTASLTPTDCSTDSKVCGNDADNKAACIDAQQPAPTVKCTRDGDETEYEVGDKYCGADNTLYTCTLSADGTTATYQSAQCQGNTPVCDNTANDCRAYKDCTLNNAPVAHNTHACDGNVSKKCNDGTLEIVEDCTTKTPAQVCLADTGVCGDAPATACTDATVGTVENGKTVCKENNVWTCNNTQLSKTTDCTVTADDTSKSFVATCIAANGDTAAHCDKKCAEDTALNEAGDACEPIDGKNIICRVNNNVAQVKRFWGGQFSEWNNCSDNQEAGTENAAEYGCNDAGDGCIVKSCVAGYHPVKGDNGKYTCEHDITMNCGTGIDGKPFEINSYHCNSDNTKVMVCTDENSTNYTATLQQAAECVASKGFTCDPAKVGTLEACACTDKMPAKCVADGDFAKVTSCDSATGKIITTDCTKNGYTKSAKCNEEANACGKPICKDGYVVANGVCGKCDVEGAESCVDGSICAVNGKCSKVAECTDSICSNGVINECTGADGAKKTLQVAKLCIDNGVGTCTNTKSCSTEIKHCNNGYLKVGDKCEAYSAGLTCTDNLCDGDEWYKCKVADGETTERHYDNPVAKPAVDANGTWACDVAEGWKLTCNKVDGVEVYVETTDAEGKKSCTLKAGMCIEDANCAADATKPKCNTTTKTCEAAPATECTGDAIQCVNETTYKSCTAEGSWDTTEKTVETGLKCDTTANKLVCKEDAAKTCNGTKVMGCKDGKLSQEIEDCATNTEGKTTCIAGECVAGGGTTPAAWEVLKAFTINKGGQGGTCVTALSDINIIAGNEGNPTCSTDNYVGMGNWDSNNVADINGVYGNANSTQSKYLAYKFTSVDSKFVRLSLGIERNHATKSAKDYQCALYKDGVFKLLSPDTINITNTAKTSFSCSFDVSALSADDKTDAEIRIIGYNATGGSQTKFHEAKIEVQK